MKLCFHEERFLAILKSDENQTVVIHDASDCIDLLDYFHSALLPLSHIMYGNS